MTFRRDKNSDLFALQRVSVSSSSFTSSDSRKSISFIQSIHPTNPIAHKIHDYLFTRHANDNNNMTDNLVPILWGGPMV